MFVKDLTGTRSMASSEGPGSRLEGNCISVGIDEHERFLHICFRSRVSLGLSGGDENSESMWMTPAVSFRLSPLSSGLNPVLG